MNISWDLLILLSFAVATLYSAFMGRNRIVGILVNIYIALAVTLVAGETVYNFASNFSIISSRFTVTEFASKTILFVSTVALLAIKSEISGLDSGGSVSKFQAALYGFLTAGVVLSTVFSFMSSSQLISLDSNFVNIVANFFVAWVVAPVLLMIGSAFVKKF